jgi:hypothetical protein
VSFKTIKSESRTFLAVIYDEQYPVGSGRCWALSLVDAKDTNEAAARLAHAGKEMLYGKDVEFLALPKAFVAPLAHVPRHIPLGDPNPLARDVQDVVGDWLEVTLAARRRHAEDFPAVRVAVAPVPGGGVVVAELTEEETQQMLANEQAAKKKSVH